MKHKPAILIAACVLAVLALVWTSNHQPEAPPTADTPAAAGVTKTVKPATSPAQNKPIEHPMLLRFAPPAASPTTYQFNLKSNASMKLEGIVPTGMELTRAGTSQTAAEGGWNRFDVEASGQLHLRYFPRAEGGWHVAGLFEHVDYRLNDTAPDFMSSLEAPFRFRMSDTGFMSEFHLSKGADERGIQILEGLVYATQVGFSREAKAAWITRERDMTGLARNQYILYAFDAANKTASLSRTKLEYVSTYYQQTGLSRPMSRSKTTIDAATCDIRVATDTGILTSLNSKTRLTSALGEQVWAIADTSFDAHRIDQPLPTVLAGSFADIQAAMLNSKLLKEKYYRSNPAYDALLAGKSLAEVIDLFEQLRAKDPVAAMELLVDFLRRNPDEASRLVDLVNRNPNTRFDDDTVNTVWGSLARAGHPEAQNAIVAAARPDGDSTTLTRFKALGHVHDIEHPEEAVIDGLWDMYETGSTSTNHDQQLKDMALLAVGSLGHADKLNDDIKAEVLERLEAALRSSDDPRDLMQALTAVGNYGGTEILDEVRSLLDSSDERVRAHAYKALRRMTSTKALETLMEFYEKETSPTARINALRALAAMPPNPIAIAWAREILPTVQETKGQVALIELLGKNLKLYPANEAALRNLLKQQLTIEAKKAVFAYISPR